MATLNSEQKYTLLDNLINNDQVPLPTLATVLDILPELLYFDLTELVMAEFVLVHVGNGNISDMSVSITRLGTHAAHFLNPAV